MQILGSKVQVSLVFASELKISSTNVTRVDVNKISTGIQMEKMIK